MFPKIWVPQNGWFIMEHLIKMDDLGVSLFSETPIYDMAYWKCQQSSEHCEGSTCWKIRSPTGPPPHATGPRSNARWPQGKVLLLYLNSIAT